MVNFIVLQAANKETVTESKCEDVKVGNLSKMNCFTVFYHFSSDVAPVPSNCTLSTM